MSKLITSVLLLVFLLPARADIPAVAIETQQNDQDICIQQATEQCMQTCQKTDDIDCSAACPENAKNQCRQAGE